MPFDPDSSTGSRLRELLWWVTSTEGRLVLCAVCVVALLLWYVLSGVGDPHTKLPGALDDL